MISCFKGTFKITSPLGYRTLSGRKEYHRGLDLVGLDDINVYAVADGVVDATPYEKDGFGYYVRQKLADGKRIYYAHMKAGSIAVKAGQHIKKGTLLGVMGSTGKSTGVHTHIELRVAGTSKENLDISAFLGIPNKTGVYNAAPITAKEAEEFVKQKCGFEEQTMEYLRQYKYSDSLFIKLYDAINN